MKFKNYILIIFILLSFLVANAQSNFQNLDKSLINSDLKAYRFYKDIKNISIKVPTVVEVSFPENFIERFNFLVLDQTTDSIEPYYFKKETLVNEALFSAALSPYFNSKNIGDLKNLVDKNPNTYVEFLLPDPSKNPSKKNWGEVKIILYSSFPITSSMLKVLFDENVVLPSTVEIRAFVDGQEKIIFAETNMYQNTINFIKTTSNIWEVKFTYYQPLRISELVFNQDNAKKTNLNAIRFLAQPNHSYRIYFDPDRFPSIDSATAENLVFAENVLKLEVNSYEKNENYVIADTDNDGIPDVQDNCPSVYNPDQKDVNSNKVGDACEDFDLDGIINSKDNCPDQYNPDQLDVDSDGIGDVCDKEESRFTEKYPWIPWVGIGFATVVLISLFILTARANSIQKQDNNQ
ncbi:MAG: thrombospondin type 3 repeat-containing protein [Minisyncoccia bacterium]